MKNEIVFRIAENSNDLDEVIGLRKKIFVDEQKIPLDLEMDDNDQKSIHAMALIENKIIGTGRLTVENKKGILSRIAIEKKYRGIGLGSKIVLKLEEEALKQKLTELTLKPHIYLEKFYTMLGYVKYGDTEKVGDHYLIKMKKILIQTSAN